MSSAEPRPLLLRSVGRDGLLLERAPEAPVDVYFEDHRVLSFGPKDTVAEGPEVRYAWPLQLVSHLHGHTTVMLRDHVSGAALAVTDVAFDDAEEPTRVVNKAGRPMAVDKAGKLGVMFQDAGGQVIETVLDIAERVLADIADFGAVAFLGYGSLLGAVRNGHVIGHDNDVDLICFIDVSEPVDLIRESLALERFLKERGWVVDRPRASFIRIATGKGYLDVFHAFHDGERMYIDRFAWVDLPASALVPLGTVEFEGRRIAAPHDPDALLAAIYGPDYLVPDPSFKHRPREELRRATLAWFGNYRRGRNQWRDWLAISHPEPPDVSRLAHVAAERQSRSGLVVDIGCGHGQDARWLAGEGFRVIAIDHAPHGLRWLANETVGREDLDLRCWEFSFMNAPKSIVYGALVAAEADPESPVLMANELLDVLGTEARENFWQFARTALLPGGRLLLSFRHRQPKGSDEPRSPRRSDPEALLGEAERYGARVVARTDADGRTDAELVWSI